MIKLFPSLYIFFLLLLDKPFMVDVINILFVFNVCNLNKYKKNKKNKMKEELNC